MYLKRLLLPIGVLTVSIIAVFLILKQPDIPFNELVKKYTNKESKLIEVDGQKVHYRQEGEGPHLLLLHGTASSLHTWDGWVEELKNHFTITRLDLPAFGLTGAHPDGNYSIDFYTSFLNEFVNQLDLDSLHVAGNSLGGGIAWSYALSHPEKVSKLVLIDASGYPSGEIPFVFKLARNDLTADLLKSITPRSFVEKNIQDVYYNDSKINDLLIDRYYELTLAPGNRQAFIDRARINMGYNHKRLSEIKAPTLILWGKYDEWVPLENAYKFNNNIEGSELVILESGHVPMEENPVITATRVKSFLKD